mgnify:FL=1
MQGSPPRRTSEQPQPQVIQGGVWDSPGHPANQIPLQQGMGMGYFAPTQAMVALVLAILGVVGCSLCTAIPGVILANSALNITNTQPGHPDAGIAKAAQIVSWITIGLAVLGLLFYASLFVFALSTGEI